MNIIIGTQDAEKMSEKYTVLPLENLKWKSHPEIPITTAYCLIETIPIPEMPKIKEQVDLHIKFYENYQKGDFNFCTNALEHLKGKWGNQLDSFYDILSDRIGKYKDTDLSNWDPVVYK